MRIPRHPEQCSLFKPAAPATPTTETRVSVPPSAAAFALEADVAASKAKPKGKRGASLDASEREAEAMRKANDWTGARGRHLVALYAWLHREVYGVDVAELRDDRAMLTAAVAAANRMLERDFGGEAERGVDFLRWTWKREARAEKRRRDEHAEGRRITWRLQFAARHLLVDYRVDLVRGRAGR